MVGRATNDTFTNKTINAANNAITGLTKADVGLGNVDNSSNLVNNDKKDDKRQTALF